MLPSAIQDAWMIDQLQKSEFFHQKLHEWGLLEVAYQIEQVKGESLAWDKSALGISETAWNRVIHQGIKPVLAFAHPQVLANVSRSLSYYRMLALVSQKSMKRIGLDGDRFEQGRSILDEESALAFARHLNAIISLLVEADENIDVREFDLWRAMAAGSQAQGSWQNVKGDRVEAIVKGRLKRRLREKAYVTGEDATGSTMHLYDGRKVIYGDEPDIGLYGKGGILAAVEIKGGIDTAGVLERVGAALKSLNRIKEENPSSLTILILQGVSVTRQAIEDLGASKAIVDHWFTVEEVLGDESKREEFFSLLGL